MAWVTPITDRTLADVEYALAHQDSIVDLKGAWNISDANRVINNTIYLRDKLNSLGYKVSFADQPLLTEDGLPYITSVIQTMKDNIRAVVNGFYAIGNPVIAYENTLNYITANDMEMNLDITNLLLENAIQEFKMCGGFYCGEDLYL